MNVPIKVSENVTEEKCYTFKFRIRLPPPRSRCDRENKKLPRLELPDGIDQLWWSSYELVTDFVDRLTESRMTDREWLTIITDCQIWLRDWHMFQSHRWCESWSSSHVMPWINEKTTSWVLCAIWMTSTWSWNGIFTVGVSWLTDSLTDEWLTDWPTTTNWLIDWVTDWWTDCLIDVFQFPSSQGYYRQIYAKSTKRVPQWGM